jgi:hypothetical protein
MVIDDVETLDPLIEAGCGSNVVAAWGRIKQFVLVALKTSPNNERDEICPHCKHEYPYFCSNGYKCYECGFEWGGQTSPVA